MATSNFTTPTTLISTLSLRTSIDLRHTSPPPPQRMVARAGEATVVITHRDAVDREAQRRPDRQQPAQRHVARLAAVEREVQQEHAECKRLRETDSSMVAAFSSETSEVI